MSLAGEAQRAPAAHKRLPGRWRGNVEFRWSVCDCVEQTSKHPSLVARADRFNQESFREIPVPPSFLPQVICCFLCQLFFCQPFILLLCLLPLLFYTCNLFALISAAAEIFVCFWYHKQAAQDVASPSRVLLRCQFFCWSLDKWQHLMTKHRPSEATTRASNCMPCKDCTLVNMQPVVCRKGFFPPWSFPLTILPPVSSRYTKYTITPMLQ